MSDRTTEDLLLQAHSIILTLSSTLTLVADAYRLADEGKPIPHGFLRERVMKAMARAAGHDTRYLEDDCTVSLQNGEIRLSGEHCEFTLDPGYARNVAETMLDLIDSAPPNPVRAHVTSLLKNASVRDLGKPLTQIGAYTGRLTHPLVVTDETMKLIESEKTRLGVDSAAAVLLHHLKNARTPE